MENIVKKSGRGGRREGAGRKQKFEGNKVVTLSFCCSPNQRDDIKKLIKESGLNQSDWILSKLL